MAIAFDILTIFPDMFAGVLGESILARSLAAGLVRVELTNIRDFTEDKHRSVDDRPYGGGPGMVFKPEPVIAAVEHVLRRERAAPHATRKLILSPQGRTLDQAGLRSLSQASWIVLLCGHYEGFDERIVEELRRGSGVEGSGVEGSGFGGSGFEELSIGDYVLSGGEIPAMAILDGVSRLLPGALGHPESAALESFEAGRLDYPQYTRPPQFRGMPVPEILLSGNHQAIDKWRRERSLERTRERRADLLAASTDTEGKRS